MEELVKELRGALKLRGFEESETLLTYEGKTYWLVTREYLRFYRVNVGILLSNKRLRIVAEDLKGETLFDDYTPIDSIAMWCYKYETDIDDLLETLFETFEEMLRVILESKEKGGKNNGEF